MGLLEVIVAPEWSSTPGRVGSVGPAWPLTSAPNTAPALILAGASLLKRGILLFIRPRFGPHNEPKGVQNVGITQFTISES